MPISCFILSVINLSGRREYMGEYIAVLLVKMLILPQATTDVAIIIAIANKNVNLFIKNLL
jgi:hypothetical protein